MRNAIQAVLATALSRRSRALGLMLFFCGATGLLRAETAVPAAVFAVCPPTRTLPDPHGSGAIKLRYTNAAQAERACRLAAAQLGGMVVQTSGTPSMEPLIHGRTYVVVKKQAFDGIRKSDILVYMGKLNPRDPQRPCTLHRAVDHDRYGWLMSGDNNRWTESWDRVTADNYLGTVVAIFEA